MARVPHCPSLRGDSTVPHHGHLPDTPVSDLCVTSSVYKQPGIPVTPGNSNIIMKLTRAVCEGQAFFNPQDRAAPVLFRVGLTDSRHPSDAD